MKLTKAAIKRFERDQIQFGTLTALYNWQWMTAAGLLKDLGVKRVRTTNPAKA